MAKNKYPKFSADEIVLDLYKNKKFINLLFEKLKLNSKKEIKAQVKLLVQKNKNKLKILESIIHPLVRNRMNKFLKKKHKILILEIPLLIENKLEKYFDKVIFVNAKKKIRQKRYLKNHNDKQTFELLNKRQWSPTLKRKVSDLTINNNYSLSILKKTVKNFMKNYE